MAEEHSGKEVSEVSQSIHCIPKSVSRRISTAQVLHQNSERKKMTKIVPTKKNWTENGIGS